VVTAGITDLPALIALLLRLGFTHNTAVVALRIAHLPALATLLNLHLFLVFKIANSSADLAASAAAAHASANSRTVESESLLAFYSVAAFSCTDPGYAGGKDDLDGAFGHGRGNEDGTLGQCVGACGAACVRCAGVAAVVVERGALQHLVDDLVGGDGLWLDEAASETIITL
jgi:hypothetical protein